MEEWRTYEKIPRYLVSDEGRVKNSRTGRILKPSVNNRGYKQVSLHEDGKHYTAKVSRMVAETFIECDEEGLDVTYIDGDPSNVCVNNLEWKSRKELINDTYKNGREQTHRMRRIRCVETGEEYRSIVECSRLTGLNAASICKCVNSPYTRTRDGRHFEPIE